MQLETRSDKGCTEVVIDNDCETDKFYQAVDVIQLNLGQVDLVTLYELDTLIGILIIMEANSFYNIIHLKV